MAQKLLDVASLVISVGQSCDSEVLGKEDLVHLQADLLYLLSCVESILNTCRHLLTHFKGPGEDRGSAQGVYWVIKNQEGVYARGHPIEDQGM